MERYAHISGWGAYVPEQVVHNDDIAQVLPTSDEWIRERTGISCRRVAADHEHASTLGLRAARRALAVADLDPGRVELILVATSTPDYLVPCTACLIQDGLGARRAGACDILAACSGFVYGVAMGAGLIRAGLLNNALVVGTEVLSRVMDWTDRSTSILFGDGAGAVVLQASEEPGGFLGATLGADGSGADFISIRIGARLPFESSAEPISELLYMNGHEVFRFASRIMVQSTRDAARSAGLEVQDLDLLIPHQANARILQVAAKQLGLPAGKVYSNLDRYGNTSAASIPLAIVDAVDEGLIQPGDRIGMVAFGGGLTWAGCVVEWTYGPADRAWSVWRRSLHASRSGVARARSVLSRLEHRLEALEDRVRRRDLERNGRPARARARDAGE